MSANKGSMDLSAPNAKHGFFLIDDCGGRFVIDRESGIVALASQDVLAREPGAVRHVGIRVVERSGASYEMTIALKITGKVPQVSGAEALDVFAPEPFTETHVAWERFAPAQASLAARGPLRQPPAAFGAVLSPAPPARAPADLAFAAFAATTPPPASERGWDQARFA